MLRTTLALAGTRISEHLWPQVRRVKVNPDTDLKYYCYLDYTRPYRGRNFDKWIVVTHDDQKIAHIDYAPETGQIGLMQVEPKYQRNGIMTRLVRHALNDMRPYSPKYCWAVTNPDPKCAPFQLFAKFGGQYSNPADASVTGDGLRFEIDCSLDCPRLAETKMLPDLRGDSLDYRNFLKFGMTIRQAQQQCEEARIQLDRLKI